MQEGNLESAHLVRLLGVASRGRGGLGLLGRGRDQFLHYFLRRGWHLQRTGCSDTRIRVLKIRVICRVCVCMRVCAPGCWQAQARPLRQPRPGPASPTRPPASRGSPRAGTPWEFRG